MALKSEVKGKVCLVAVLHTDRGPGWPLFSAACCTCPFIAWRWCRRRPGTEHSWGYKLCKVANYLILHLHVWSFSHLSRNSHFPLCPTIWVLCFILYCYFLLFQFRCVKLNLCGIASFSTWSLTLRGESSLRLDPEANIWAQEGWEWGVEKAPQWGTS